MISRVLYLRVQEKIMNRVLLLYMPVIHRGYLDFLIKHHDECSACYVLDHTAIEILGDEVAYIVKKDSAIRGLPASTVRDFIASLHLFEEVKVLCELADVQVGVEHIICPDEDVSTLACDRFFPGIPVKFDSLVRLRYDRKGVERVDAVPSVECTSNQLHRQLMGKAVHAAFQSKDWWLSVGALIARDGKPLLVAWNRGAVDDDIVNILGDPRSLYSRGEKTESTLMLHAERGLVARAAHDGICLAGTDAFVTHFPCVPCASLLAEAGIKNLYFKSGYSRLESSEVFRARGVNLFRVV